MNTGHFTVENRGVVCLFVANHKCVSISVAGGPLAAIPLMDYRAVCGVAAKFMYRATNPSAHSSIARIRHFRDQVTYEFVDGTTLELSGREQIQEYWSKQAQRQIKDGWQIHKKALWISKQLHPEWVNWREAVLDPLYRIAQSRTLGWYGKIPAALLSGNRAYIMALAYSNAALASTGIMMYPRSFEERVFQSVMGGYDGGYEHFAIDLYESKVELGWREDLIEYLRRMYG